MRIPTILTTYTPVRRLVLYLLEAEWVKALAARIPFSLGQGAQPVVVP